MNKIYVLGMGPGHPDYVLPLTHRLIGEAGVLIGGERHLAAYADSGKICFPMRGKPDALLDIIRRERLAHQVAVLVSGDPGFFSLLNFLRLHFPPDELRVEPGISAVQYLMARIGEPWHGAALASLHGRECAFHALIERHHCTVLLTDEKRSAHRVADSLRSMAKIEVVVGAELSSPQERIVRGTPMQILEEPPFGMATVAVINHDI